MPISWHSRELTWIRKRLNQIIRLMSLHSAIIMMFQRRKPLY